MTSSASPGTVTATSGGQAHRAVTGSACSAWARSFAARVSRREAIALAGGSDARYLASSGSREPPSPPVPLSSQLGSEGFSQLRRGRGGRAALRLVRAETYSAQQETDRLAALDRAARASPSGA